MLPRQRWIPSPDREEIKPHTDDEQRDRKMNDYRVLARVLPARQFLSQTGSCDLGAVASKVRGEFALTSGLLEFAVAQLRANCLNVLLSHTSKSRIVCWPSLITMGTRMYPAFSARAATV